MASSPQTRPRSFDPPQEPEWHRMIAEAAYYFAQKRGFDGEHSLDDWLAAEKQVRQVISPLPESEASMNETANQKQSEAKDDAPAASGSTPKPAASQFEKFAATQAAGDGVQGDVRKSNKTVDEKIGANMADRK